jgi:hypothetical protein
MKNKSPLILLLSAMIFSVVINAYLASGFITYKQKYRKLLLENDSISSVNLIITHYLKSNLKDQVDETETSFQQKHVNK